MQRFLLILFFSSTIGFAQQKFEREYRIKLTDAPQTAQQIIKMWSFTNKVKWYAEESNDGKTYEAKVRHQKYLYSIEFSENGNILDVEKTVLFRKLDIETQRNIQKSLAKKFKKFKIKKTQIQYTGDESEIYSSIFKLEKLHAKAIIKYELIVKGKVASGYKRYEILLDKKGRIIKELPFKLGNSINLEF